MCLSKCRPTALPHSCPRWHKTMELTFSDGQSDEVITLTTQLGLGVW